jgi:hypothetical protein
LAEKVSEKLHEAYKKVGSEVTMAKIAALKPKDFQPAELLSTANYKPGEMIEYQSDGQKPVRMAEVLGITAQGVQVKGQLKGAQELVSFDKVVAVYGKRSVKRILNKRERRLEAERHGKRASQKSACPAKPGRDSGVNDELSTKWTKATGVLSATRHRVEHSAKLPATGANYGATEAPATVGG